MTGNEVKRKKSMKLRDSGTKIFAIPIFFFLSNAVADV